MGPIVSPWTALPLGRRWLILLAIPLGTMIAALPAVSVAPAASPASDPVEDLDAIARLHRLWVADHGPGCARDVAHLAVYGAVSSDRWGEPLHLTCDRTTDDILVTVSSAGPDRVLGTRDDRTGIDRDPLVR